MHAELLISPVEHGAKGKELGGLHSAEVCFDVVLRAVSQDDFLVTPLSPIDEEDGFLMELPKNKEFLDFHLASDAGEALHKVEQ